MLISRSTLIAVAILTVIASGGESRAGFVTIGWAGVASPGTNPPVSLDKILGAPDGRLARFDGDNPVEATVSGFSTTAMYDESDLATLLGVSLATLQQAEVITFDLNGLEHDIESATWTFSANGLTEVFHTGSAGPNTPIATGMIAAADYTGFFSTGALESPFPSFALFTLQSVDSTSADFAVRISAVGVDPHSPDLDSVGVIRSSASAVPEPSSFTICGLGILGCIGARWRRRHRDARRGPVGSFGAIA
jgi:hypothetical protein